ncbi:MAG TPA: DUF3667 domain-containing protein [Pseudomonadales bacterium]|nr:DUF3667 domain-containing protein [Pseudomonadales bacterium]
MTQPPAPAARCLNCGEVLEGPFCGRCGQRRDLRPLSLVALLWDLLVEVLDTDARVWRTLRTLVLRPGQLTLDWMHGRRTRHVPPLRLYLVLNLIAFLVISQQAGPIDTEGPIDSEGPIVASADTTTEQLEARLDAELQALADATSAPELQRRERLATALAALRGARDERRRALRSALGAPATEQPAAAADDAELGELVAFLEGLGYSRERVEAALQRILDDPREFLEAAFDRVPTVMILLLPVLAMVLRLLYLLSGRPFVVHLVGLAHLHAFIFLLILLVEGFLGIVLLIETLGLPAVADLVRTATVTAGAIALFTYGLLWLRRLYGHGWFGAMGMSLTIMLLHLIGLAVGVTLLLAGSFVLEVIGNG